MQFQQNEKGVSLIEVVASIVILSILLISFFSFFLQSKKTHVASESIVDATYVAQRHMETVYGRISSPDTSSLQDITSINSHGTIFNPVTDATCENDCKKFLAVDDSEHWIKLKLNDTYPNLVNVLVNVPKKNSPTPVVMESIFRLGD